MSLQDHLCISVGESWPGLHPQLTVSMRTFASTQVDCCDLVQHLAKCSTAMQQRSAHCCLFTGWISHSCTASDCWITLCTENRDTAGYPPPLLLYYTTTTSLHTLIQITINRLAGITSDYCKEICLNKNWSCRFSNTKWSSKESHTKMTYICILKNLLSYDDTMKTICNGSTRMTKNAAVYMPGQ